MKADCIKDAKLEETGFSYTMSLIQGKYKMFILYTLMEYGVVRYNELKNYLAGISFKTLTSSLKQLEADGLVKRKEYPQIPPKVEYSLTETGKSFVSGATITDLKINNPLDAIKKGHPIGCPFFER